MEKTWTSFPKPDTYKLKVGIWYIEIKKQGQKWKASFSGHTLRVKGGFSSGSVIKEFPTLAAAKKAVVAAAKKELSEASKELIGL